MKRNRLCGIVLLSFFVSATAFAQKPRLYTSESELPNSKINVVCQDRKGFVWIGTEDGLARFDGMNFTSFHNRKGDPSVSEITLSMLEDSHGTCWVGTSMGLQIFNQEQNSFRKFNLNDSESPESTQYIYTILEIPGEKGKSNILAASSQHGVYVIDSGTHELNETLRDAINASTGSMFTHRLFLDSKGRLWTASEFGGIKVLDSKDFSSIQKINDSDAGGMQEDAMVTVFAEDAKTGNIIIGTTNHGIIIYDEEAGRIRPAADASARSCTAMALLNDSDYHKAGDRFMLVGTENNGLKVFDLDTESIQAEYSFNIPYSTDSWKIHTLMKDRQGNIWAAAYQTGLLLIPQSMFGFSSVAFSQNMIPGENSACVTSIIEYGGEKSMWIGTDGGGLFHTMSNNRTTNFTDSNSALPDNSIMSLAIDRRGLLWIATYLDGITTYSSSKGFRPFEDNAHLGTSKVFCLLYDEDRDIMYAGTHGNGLSVIEASSGKIIRTISEDLNKWINTLFIDKTGMLWIGTNNGPMCYNPENERLYAYDVSDGQPIARVSAISQTSDGTMWLGTDEGLVSFTKDSGKSVIYNEESGLSSNSVHGIIEDGEGHLWISTSKGLTRFSPSDGTFSRYYTHDGLQGNEFRTNAAFKGKGGEIHFGGNNGITSFYPQTIGQKTHEIPQVYFTKLLVGGVECNYVEDSKDNVLDKFITDATSITLPHSRNAFSIQYSVPEFSNPQRIRYLYKLEKLDKEWKEAPLVKAAIYTNLPHGRYTLTVKAFFDGNEEDFTTRSIRIRILPPASLSFWAIALYLLLAAAVLAFILDYMKKIVKHKKEQEESEINEMKLQMFTNLSHEIRTPLTLVMSPLNKMRESEGDSGKKDLYNLMYRNSLRILRLVNQVMDIQKVDNGQMKMQFQDTDMVFFIKDIMKSFENMATTRNIDFTISPSDGTKKLWIDQNNFDKVIFNILSNAFKYTPEGGKISVDISEEKENNGRLASGISKYVDITITNSGSNIAPENIGKIFDRYYQTDIHDAKTGSGVGLNLAKMLTDLHHGKIEARNVEGGVAFTISMPAGKTHLSEEELNDTAASDLYTKEINSESIIVSTDDVNAEEKIMEDDSKRFKSKKTVVFIDDNVEMLNYIKSELKDSFNIEVYTNSKDAWAAVTANQPDAIVADLIMETETEGAEFCEKVKHNPGTNMIPVLILTSKTDEDSIQKCTECGADRYLTKPISTKLLKSSIVQAIVTREIIKNKYTSEVGYDYDEVKMSSSEDKLLNKVIESIKANIDNPNYGVEDLSRDVGMSRVHMNRKLKECISLSPSNLIKAIRLKQAAYLLANNKVNISEVAYRVGFSTHSYFSSTFHDYFGLTPKEFVAKYSDSKDDESLQKLLEL